MPYSTLRKRIYVSFRDDPDLFWAKVDIGTKEECWLWRGTIKTNGYGIFGKKNEYAHRFAFELATGVSPGQGFICHRCDNPPCCNPSHLFLGDARANAQDMAAKGRVGGGQPLLLNPEMVAVMRGQGMSFRAIGRHFGTAHKSAINAFEASTKQHHDATCNEGRTPWYCGECNGDVWPDGGEA